ncbi:MAG: cupin domain-containing protein [candidate division Zixibacteria bacterium]|nr:cupin domain-containing protein [candidate division Zixibacteria bacterium]
MPREELFPEIITGLPRADVAGEGVRAYLLQGEGRQVAFVAFDADVDAPGEAHAAQWVVVLAGEVELTTAGEKAVYRRGDTYYIPAGVAHSARVKKGSRLLDLFDQADRYTVR